MRLPIFIVLFGISMALAVTNDHRAPSTTVVVVDSTEAINRCVRAVSENCQQTVSTEKSVEQFIQDMQQCYYDAKILCQDYN